MDAEMEMQGRIRTSFHEKMDHFDFMHLFFNSDKKCFRYIREENILTMNDIEEMLDDNGVVHKPEDGGLYFGMHTVRVYEVNGQWLMYYHRKYFAVNTENPHEEQEGIIVYKTISDRVKEKLPSKTSYDGRMQCWMF